MVVCLLEGKSLKILTGVAKEGSRENMFLVSGSQQLGFDMGVHRREQRRMFYQGLLTSLGIGDREWEETAALCLLHRGIRLRVWI